MFQQKQCGTLAKRFDDEIVLMSDKFLEYKCITPINTKNVTSIYSSKMFELAKNTLLVDPFFNMIKFVILHNQQVL